MEIPYEERDVAGKRVRQARFSICPEDVFVLMSDGVTHAGLGSYLDLGWRWENVATYMENAVLRDKSPRTLQNLLLQACKACITKRFGTTPAFAFAGPEFPARPA